MEATEWGPGSNGARGSTHARRHARSTKKERPVGGALIRRKRRLEFSLVKLQRGRKFPHDGEKFKPGREPGEESLPGLIVELHALGGGTATSVKPEKDRDSGMLV